MAEPMRLDFIGDDRLAGFRLMRLEVLNWGTFDKRVWTLEGRSRLRRFVGSIASATGTTAANGFVSWPVPPRSKATIWSSVSSFGFGAEANVFFDMAFNFFR